MSTYKLISVVKTTEKETQSIYNKDDFKTASDDMCNAFGVALKADTTLAVYCSVIDNETGKVVDNLYWTDQSVQVSDAIKPRVYTHNDYQEDNIAAYDSEKLALGNFYTKWATYSKKEDCNFAIVVLLDNMGNETVRMVKKQEVKEEK